MIRGALSLPYEQQKYCFSWAIFNPDDLILKTYQKLLIAYYFYNAILSCMEFRVINTSHKKKWKNSKRALKINVIMGMPFYKYILSHHVRPIFINIEAMEKQVVIINSLMSDLIETFVAKIFSLCKWLAPWNVSRKFSCFHWNLVMTFISLFEALRLML